MVVNEAQCQKGRLPTSRAAPTYVIITPPLPFPPNPPTLPQPVRDVCQKECKPPGFFFPREFGWGGKSAPAPSIDQSVKTNPRTVRWAKFQAEVSFPTPRPSVLVGRGGSSPPAGKRARACGSPAFGGLRFWVSECESISQ